MKLILGIDPGVHTGVATFKGGALVGLQTIKPHELERVFHARKSDRVIFEDSRLTSYTWTRGKNMAASLKMARNVGQVDGICAQIEAICAENGIECHGVSPKGKGAKLDAAKFKAATGWDGGSNQHERDAAMVAWRFRNVAK